MSVSDGVKLGSGLVEVSAVATIIGGPVAEKLALGEKAAPGLPWASMSAFGAIHVIKVSASACMPDWAREVLGLRNDGVDAAVGACVMVDNRRRGRRRADLGDACAIRMPHFGNERFVGQILPFQKVIGSQVSEPPVTIFYTLDRTATMILNTISRSRSGLSLLIYEYILETQGPSSRFRDIVDGESPRFQDNAVLFASCAKGVEIVTLWHLRAQVLWWATALGWAAAFQGAVLLLALGLSRDHLSRPRTDLLSGTLPSHAVEGGDGFIVLGIPDNVRRHIVWRMVWAFTALANLASLLGVFLSLGSQPPHVVYTWILFQAIWLLARSVVYRILEGASACEGILQAKSWDEAPVFSRRQAVKLLLGLSRQQITIHPRGIRAYRLDTLSASHIVSLFESVHYTLTLTLTLPSRTSGMLDETATVHAVVGDPVLRSIVWAHSPSLSSSDMYDCALVFLRVDETLCAVPSVRVYSCNCISVGTIGNTHPDDCTLIEWVMFVPHQAGWWYLHSTEATGRMPAVRLDDAELDGRLELAKMWNISLRSIKEVKSILALSRAAAELLRDMASKI